ncbi:PAS fold-containing protein [Desulfuromusa kysingii]|uniref:histidine kinase n=1 Tax=Desulfuromusa kysingii TaxID=37625 RepID=A0A1H4DKF2_9BACT|nr:ATP-binding protein [Desulfuromusa kysingii]SEA72969.1 PAS fold-containing protein [Desulfuromusa kysingii]
MAGLDRNWSRLKSGIARKLVIYLFLCSSVITIVGTSLQLYLEYSRDIRSIETSLSQIEVSYLQSLIASLWVSNDSFLEIQLDGLLKIPDIEYVEIRREGEASISVGHRGQAKVIEREYPLNYQYRDKEIPLGTLHVVADLQGVYQRLIDRALIIISTLAVKTFLVSFFMLFLVYAVVGRHLHSLAAYTNDFDPDSEDAPLRLNRRSNKGEDGDELDLVVHSINQMGTNLKTSFREQQRINDQLRQEIAERERVEVALRRSEQKFKDLSQEFQVILDGIPDALTLLSPDLKVVWANKGAADLLDKELMTLSGQHCYQLWHQHASACEDCLGSACFKTGEPLDGTRTTTDGRVWGKRVFPLKDKEGKVTNVIEWSSEITEKLKLAEEAATASRLASLGELSAGVAHEINNPIAMILLNVPVLQQAFDAGIPILEQHCREHGDFELGGMDYSEVLKEVPLLLAGMIDSAERIRRTVDDLKDFVRQDSNDPTETIDINQAVQTAVRLARGAIKKATDHFISSCAENLVPVRGGRQKIEQVLINLIMNACQALPDRTRKISITTTYDSAQAANIVTVSDQGVGIEAHHLPCIMDPFFTTKRESGGTGLGLSISARIVKEYGGHLDFSSTPGEGTTAVLALPILQKENQRG